VTAVVQLSLLWSAYPLTEILMPTSQPEALEQLPASATIAYSKFAPVLLDLQFCFLFEDYCSQNYLNIAILHRSKAV
jgi:hypothetical protein